jgi:6-phosphogluconolactonase
MALARVYIATQKPGAAGIAHASFDSNTGELSEFDMVAATSDPGFLAVNPLGTHLYVANAGTPGGVTSFRLDGTAMTPLNFVQSQGRGPSYISLDHTARYVLEANYGGAFIEVHVLEESGALGAQTAFVQHTGHSVHPERQTRAYPHWFGTDPSNRFALVSDLGADCVYIYRFDRGNVTPSDPPFVRTRAGSGPRHLAWHPNGHFAYLIHELSNEITCFEWDGNGALNALKTISTVASDFDRASTAAEIAVHRSGRFLVASNRGEDSLVVFTIEADGRLAFRQRIKSGGKTPRYFAFDPSQQWLLVSNQGSDDVAVFRVDSNTGEVSLLSERAVGKPAGIVVIPQ